MSKISAMTMAFHWNFQIFFRKSWSHIKILCAGKDDRKLVSYWRRTNVWF